MTPMNRAILSNLIAIPTRSDRSNDLHHSLVGVFQAAFARSLGPIPFRKQQGHRRDGEIAGALVGMDLNLVDRIE